MASPRKILVYQDYVHNNGVLYHRLGETYGHENVRFCDAGNIEDLLTSGIFLFVMPGGADLYYGEKLNGEGNQRIRAYVEAGGHYLGICAGAYYASREIDWANGDIAGTRELNFIDAKATGPVFEFLEDNDINKSWQNIVTLTASDETCPTLYYGGPVFDRPGFATYPNGQTAIVIDTVGKGTVILSSPHIEYTPEDLRKTLYKNLNPSYDWIAKNLCEFEKIYEPERDIWPLVMKEFE